MTIIEKELLAEKVQKYPDIFDKTVQGYKVKDVIIICLVGQKYI